MNLLSRIQGICLQPAAEWQTVATENTDPRSLYLGYILPLAAIGPLASFIGLSVFGISMPFVGTVRIGFAAGLGMLLSSYVLTLLMVAVLAGIASALAPTFGGRKDFPAALRLLAYASTPAWLAGILQLVPMLGVIGLLAALYSLYLLYLGLPLLMGSRREKSLPYTLVLLVAGIVAGFVVSAAGSLFMPSMHGAARVEADGPLGKALGGSEGEEVARRLEEMGKRMEEAAQKAEQAQQQGDHAKAAEAASQAMGALMSGGKEVQPLSADELQTLLPAALGGLARSDAGGEREEMGGVVITRAYGNYGDGAPGLEVSISDMGGASMMLAGMNMWASVPHASEDQDQMERNGRLQGRPFHAEYSKSGRSGQVSVVVGERFLVVVSGQDMDYPKIESAVAALDLAALEARKDAGRGR